MPVDRGAIDRQLRDIGEGEHWWEQREFRDLCHVLHPEERIAGLVKGRLLGRRRPRLPRLPGTGEWLIVATDQRLICLKQERFGRKQIDLPTDVILRIEQGGGLRRYQVTVHTTTKRYRIRIAKNDAFRFARALGPLMPSRPASTLPPALQPLAWIPGMTAVASLPGVGRIVSEFSPAPPEPASRASVERLEATVDRLETDVERLQQQVAFLEELLERRAAEPSYLPQAIDS